MMVIVKYQRYIVPPILLHFFPALNAMFPSSFALSISFNKFYTPSRLHHEFVTRIHGNAVLQRLRQLAASKENKTTR